MTKPLAYLSLKCVVEYLEANKRFLISDRNPVFDELERKIPLHLDYFCPWNNQMTFNDTTYKIRSVTRRVLKNLKRKDDYIDIPEDFENWSWKYRGMVPGDLISFYIKRQGTSNESPTKRPISVVFNLDPDYQRVLSYDDGNCEATRRVIEICFGERREILVKRFELSFRMNIHILPSLKLQVQELVIVYLQLTNAIHKLLYLPSGKLKSLKLKESSREDSSFDLPIVQTADKLFIHRIDRFWAPWHLTLLKLPNRQITFEGVNLTERVVTDFVHGLLNEGRQIGTSYTFIGQKSGSILKILKTIGKRYKRKVSTKWKNGLSIYKYSVSFSMHLPMKSISELFIHGTHTRYKNHTTMEVVPINPLKLTF